jgi:hypothetical protein
VTVGELGSIGELVAAIATVATLGYLGVQIRTSNRLARAEASRGPASDLNAINASFGTSPTFLAGFRLIYEGAVRAEIEPLARAELDFYLVSVANLQEQLAREVREGILDEAALDMGGNGLFSLPYFRTSWPLYRPYLSSGFVLQFEERYGLDPTIPAVF